MLSSPTLLLPLTFSPTPPIPSASLPNPPLQIYRDRRVISYRLDITSSPFEVPAPSSSALNTDDLPIALGRGMRTCTQHLIVRCVSYDRISSCLHSFACALSSISIPSSYKKALASSGSKHVMDEEMSALHKKVAKNKKRNQSKQN